MKLEVLNVFYVVWLKRLLILQLERVFKMNLKQAKKTYNENHAIEMAAVKASNEQLRTIIKYHEKKESQLVERIKGMKVI